MINNHNNYNNYPNWYKLAQYCNYKPLNSPKRIDVYTLIDDVINIHFKDDTLNAEESDIGIRLNNYYWYDLKLLRINELSYIESPEDAPVEIIEDNIIHNKELIVQNNNYPPIVVDVMNNVIDGYHRVFALKELGCNKVWAYVPDQTSKIEEDENIEEDEK
jgi:hypothetical protein